MLDRALMLVLQDCSPFQVELCDENLQAVAMQSQTHLRGSSGRHVRRRQSQLALTQAHQAHQLKYQVSILSH